MSRSKLSRGYNNSGRSPAMSRKIPRQSKKSTPKSPGPGTRQRQLQFSISRYTEKCEVFEKKANQVLSTKPLNGHRVAKKRARGVAERQLQLPLVRRSTRKCGGVLQKEARQALATKLLNEVEDGLKIIHTQDKGRGVAATHSFSKGDFLCEYSGELLDMKQAKVKEREHLRDAAGCYMYYFMHRDTKWCVDATADNGRMGRLVNHSRTNPNVVTKVEEVEGKPRLYLMADRDIEPGEELQYDYGDRSPEVLQAHPWLLS